MVTTENIAVSYSGEDYTLNNSDGNIRIKGSSVTVTTDIINTTGKSLSLGYRDGLLHSFKHTPVGGVHGVVVYRKIYSVPFSNEQEILRAIEQPEYDDPGLAPLRHAVQNGGAIRGHMETKYIVDWHVPLHDIQQCGGVIYFEQGDVVISTFPTDETPPHPESIVGRELAAIRDQGTGDGILNLMVEIVDNKGWIGEKYANIFGKAYKVVPIKDSRRSDGVYLTGNRSMCDTARLVRDTVSVWNYNTCTPNYKGDDAAPIKLYASPEDALTLGNAQSILDEQLKQKAFDLEVLKGKLEEDKLAIKREHEEWKYEADKRSKELDQQHAEHKQRLEKFNLERETLAKEVERARKDHYDSRSHGRKDTSEVLKFLPIILSGIAAVAAFR
jgi:hypothetical protein